MGIEFKEDIKIAKETLITVGKFLVEIRQKTNIINEELSEFNTSKNNIFDDTLDISTRYIDEALDLIKIQLGKMELDERLAQKK